MLLLLPLSDEYMKASSPVTPFYENADFILKKGNFYAYQIGMAIWGIGGLMFCYLLYRSGLVPRPFPIWGYAGYLIFISGTILEIYGLNIGVYLAVPGGLFEIGLSIWLIVKGFDISKMTSVESLKEA